MSQFRQLPLNHFHAEAFSPPELLSDFTSLVPFKSFVIACVNSERPAIEATGQCAKTASAPPDSKQSRVVAMLRTPADATLAGLMEATGWQKHSMHGFLAGVVGKRLKLKLTSEKVNGDRIYRIVDASTAEPRRRSSKTRSR
jgi:hypothetical protein